MTYEYLHPSDVKKSHVLTRMIEKQVEEPAVYNVPFAPLYGTMQRKVKVMVREFDPAGLAQFHADNANTPVVKGGGEVEERYMELVEISEKHVLKASDLIALESPDPSVAEGAARDVVKLGAQLQQRNIQRTKWMAYMAARDALSIEYPDGASISIDFDLDGDTINTDFSGSHQPTYADIGDGYAWDNTDDDGNYNADAIEALYTWTKLIEDDLGVQSGECILHLNKATWRYLKKNEGIKGELSAQNPRIVTPRLAEVVEILEIAEIRVVNDFYKVETDDTTKYRYVPDGYVLLTAPYVVNGTPIMEMYDGPVVRLVGEDLVVERNPGMVADIYANKEQRAKNIRLSTARMPVMNYPAGFVYAQVY
jgi:hypothetical protein